MLLIMLKAAAMSGDLDATEQLIKLAGSEGFPLTLHHYAAGISTAVGAQVSRGGERNLCVHTR